MITIKHKGSFKNIETFFTRSKNMKVVPILEKYGAKGISALSAATPKDSGKTASSWDYRITRDTSGYNISWFNKNVSNGIAIAILIQYGHGTGTGGYVQAYDYINPSMKSIFDSIADELWKEVTSL